jgi:hypothetical protein
VLHQNAPNPFAGETTISFSLPRPAHYRLTLHDAGGREIRLIDEGHASGTVRVTLHAGDLASGVYFYRLATGDTILSHRAVLVR